MSRRPHSISAAGDDTKFPLSEPNAEIVSSVRIGLYLTHIGRAPVDLILPSTKPPHDLWNEFGFIRSAVTFWNKVEVADSGCWHWTGAIDANGYGRTGRSPYWYEQTAHRRAWEMLRYRPAPRTSGLWLDHQCHNEDPECVGLKAACLHRRCVNPDHIEERSASDNVRASHRKLTTECRQGHPMSGPNLYVNPRTGQRTCRQCVREATERWLDKDGNRERQNAMRAARRVTPRQLDEYMRREAS